MVDFTLTDEQKNLREMAHDFAVKEIRPVAWEYDKDGTWPADVIKHHCTHIRHGTGRNDHPFRGRCGCGLPGRTSPRRR